MCVRAHDISDVTQESDPELNDLYTFDFWTLINISVQFIHNDQAEYCIKLGNTLALSWMKDVSAVSFFFFGALMSHNWILNQYCSCVV